MKVNAMQLKLMQPHISNSLRYVAAAAGVLCAGLLLSGCGPRQEDIDAARESIDEAEALVEEYRFADALEKYEEALDRDPGAVALYTGIAKIYAMKNRIGDAREILTAGTSSAREPGEAYRMLCSLELENGSADDAISDCKEALKYDKNDAESQFLLAESYVESGDFESAVDELDISKDAGEWYVRGLLLKAVLLGDETEEAGEAVDLALDIEDIDEELSEILIVYDGLLERVNELDEEESTPEYVHAILSYGALVCGYEDVVIERLEPYATDESEYWDLFLYLGRAYLDEGETDKAIELLSTAASINPSYSGVPWYLARAYAESGKMTEMENSYIRAIAIADQDEKLRIRREYIGQLEGNGRYEALAEQIALLITEDPEHHDEYVLFESESAVKREKYDEAEEAVASLDEAMLTEEEQAKYYWIKASAALGTGDLVKAQENAEKSIELSEYTPEYHFVLGTVLFERGLMDEAKSTLERAVDLDLEGSVSAGAVKILDRI